MVIGILEASGDTFGGSWRVIGRLFLVSGQLLGALFLILEAPWGTLWHQMAPRTDFFWIWDAFWDPIWEAFGVPGGVWEVIWEPFGGLWEVFGCFFLVLSWKV